MGKKILLADDSITIQKVIELTFSDEDFEVVTVGNGRLAVERVVDVRPDIVLCDIIMPEKDGYEVCDFIKRNPQLARVPVLLLTGAFEPFDQERAARVGCDGFLAKPFEPETLIAKVKDLLQKAAVARPGSMTGPQAIIQMPPPNPLPSSSMTGPQRVVQISPPTPPPLAVTPPSPAPSPVVVMPAPSAPTPPPAPLPPEPAPVAFEPPQREPLPFTRPAPPPVEEVRFIPDEPFDNLDSPDFAAPPPAVLAPSTPPPSATPPTPEPTPVFPSEPEVYSVAEELPTEPEELLQITPEESESLAATVDDSSSTVVFRPGAMSWTQQPTIEVPLEARAQASIESAQASMGVAPVVEEETVFEEVLEEEVDGLLGVEPALPESPSLSSSTVAIGVTSYEAPAPPAPLPEEPRPPAAAVAQEDIAPEPAAPPPAYAPEPVVPALESAAPIVAPVPPPAPEPEPASSIEAFVGAPPTSEEPLPPPSVSAEMAVPNEMVAQIAQRVVAQISEKVVRQIAWEVIPDLAEGLLKKEIERLKAELQET